MSKEILHILEKFLTQVMLGSNFEGKKVSILTRKNASQPFTSKECSLSEAIEESFSQTANVLPQRLLNPLWKLMFKLTG